MDSGIERLLRMGNSGVGITVDEARRFKNLQYNLIVQQLREITEKQTTPGGITKEGFVRFHDVTRLESIHLERLGYILQDGIYVTKPVASRH